MEAKVILITGSSSGIGEATAYLYAKHGYKVAVHGTNQEKIDKVVAECTKLSPQNHPAIGLALDFSVDGNGEAAVTKTVEHFGRLDILVNNTGAFIRSSYQQPDVVENYKRCVMINIDSTVGATIAAIPHLHKSKGNIIFVSSVASTKPALNGFAYCMSKAAMTMFAKCMALELAPDIRVNVVSPGPVETDIFSRVGIDMELARSQFAATTLVNRMGQSDEVAKTIFFLTSDDAAFIIGHELVIDGGYLLKGNPIQFKKP